MIPHIVIQLFLLYDTPNLSCPPRSQLSPASANLETEYEFMHDSAWELPRTQLQFMNVLGEGAFGRVMLSVLGNEGLEQEKKKKKTDCRPGSRKKMKLVAVKMLKEGHSDQVKHMMQVQVTFKGEHCGDGVSSSHFPGSCGSCQRNGDPQIHWQPF